MFSNLLDLFRIIITMGAFFTGYLIGYNGDQYNPEAQLHIMIPMVIVAIAGISGLEGLLAGKKAAAAKGFVSDGNYQRQSAIALLSYAVISLVVCFCNWGIKAELTILFAFFFFFLFSAINHTMDAILRKNYRWQNINRPFLVLLLIAGMIHPVIMVLR